MIVVSKDDKYISTTWGASIRLEAGVPKEVGQDLGVLCLQEGCTEYKPDLIKDKKPSEPIRARTDKGHYIADDPSTPDVNEAYVGGETPVKKKPTVKKTVVKKTIKK
jgi:hypothetical protein